LILEIDFFKPRKFDDFELTATKWTLFIGFAVFQALPAKKPVTVTLPYRVINQLQAHGALKLLVLTNTFSQLKDFFNGLFARLA